MNKLPLLFCVAVICGSGCKTKGPSFDPRENAPSGAFQPIALTNQISKTWLQPPGELYRLGPGDVIDIEIIGEAASHSPLVVGPDGKIYFSILPGLSVWGLTLSEARSALQKQLGQFTRATPEMVVNLRTVGSKRVWLLGYSGSAGVYTLATPTTLLEAISAVGGVPFAGVDDVIDLPKSFVLRDGRMVPVDFERLFKQGDLTQNIYLQPDDFIFLRPASSPSVYVLGAVGSPGIVPHSRDLTVASAVIGAGGTVKYAQQSQVVIIRGGLTKPQIAEVDFQSIVKGRATNVRLQPVDIVYVPYSPFRKIAQLAEDVLDQFVRTIAVNEGARVIDRNSQPVTISVPGGSTSGGPGGSGGTGGTGGSGH